MKKPEHLDEAFEKVCEEMADLFVKKYKDYGKGNILDTKELGIAFRINDKLNRLRNILENNQTPQNEPIDETWQDIAVYAVIAILYRRGWFQELELKEDK
jgi:hypothetical protein